MKHQRRYTSESQIIRAIDECHARSTQFLEEAERLEQEAVKHAGIANELFDAGNYGKALSVQNISADLRKKAGKLRTSATNLVDKKAKTLGHTLAAFRTQPMDLILQGDLSVVEQ